MKYLLPLFLFAAFTTHAQSDTVDVYVINNTNRLVAIHADGKESYSLFYRDLKHLTETEEILFADADDVIKFFDTCDKALAKDITVVSKGYNISRNKLSKKVARINDKQGGYFLLKNDTIDSMRKALTTHNK